MDGILTGSLRVITQRSHPVSTEPPHPLLEGVCGIAGGSGAGWVLTRWTGLSVRFTWLVCCSFASLLLPLEVATENRPLLSDPITCTINLLPPVLPYFLSFSLTLVTPHLVRVQIIKTNNGAAVFAKQLTWQSPPPSSSSSFHEVYSRVSQTGPQTPDPWGGQAAAQEVLRPSGFPCMDEQRSASLTLRLQIYELRLLSRRRETRPRHEHEHVHSS